jgi:hypothetical protein
MSEVWRRCKANRSVPLQKRSSSNPGQGSRRKQRKTSHLNVSTVGEDFQADPNSAGQVEASPEPEVEELQAGITMDQLEPGPEPKVSSTFRVHTQLNNTTTERTRHTMERRWGNRQDNDDSDEDEEGNGDNKDESEEEEEDDDEDEDEDEG